MVSLALATMAASSSSVISNGPLPTHWGVGYGTYSRVYPWGAWCFAARFDDMAADTAAHVYDATKQSPGLLRPYVRRAVPKVRTNRLLKKQLAGRRNFYLGAAALRPSREMRNTERPASFLS